MAPGPAKPVPGLSRAYARSQRLHLSGGEGPPGPPGKRLRNAAAAGRTHNLRSPCAVRPRTGDTQGCIFELQWWALNSGVRACGMCHWRIDCEAFQQPWAAGKNGPPGSKGKAGPPGSNGKDGPPGPQGAPVIRLQDAVLRALSFGNVFGPSISASCQAPLWHDHAHRTLSGLCMGACLIRARIGSHMSRSPLLRSNSTVRHSLPCARAHRRLGAFEPRVLWV